MILTTKKRGFSNNKHVQKYTSTHAALISSYVYPIKYMWNIHVYI